jgi:hypothetical protein
MKMFQLQRINKKSNTEDAQTEGQKKPENAGPYGLADFLTWSGDVEQAGRKLEFDLAYTTRDKDLAESGTGTGGRSAVYPH